MKVIAFNDDNHAERVWLNGTYIGDTSNISSLVATAAKMECLNDEEIDSVCIYVCDDFENFDEDDEIVDNIWDWFYNVDVMTEEQIDLVFKKDWIKLNELISEVKYG